jgi:site-specific DNA-methyltransferase (adenine-specific)
MRGGDGHATQTHGMSASRPAPARLVVGNCVDVMRDLATSSCALVLADPPYEGVVSAKWDQVKDYMVFSRAWLSEAVRVLRPGGAPLVYGSPERSWISRLTVLLEDELGMELVQNLSWVYNQGGGSRVSSMNKYAVQHELLIWFQKPGGKRTYNAEEGVEHYAEEDRAVALAKGVGRVTNASLDRGRPPRSFLDFARENSRSKERQHGTHPSMKPLGLCAHLVKLHSNLGDRVFVPFVGSGSELLSAAKLGRVACGAEVNVQYTAIAERRFEAHGLSVTLERPATAEGATAKRPRHGEPNDDPSDGLTFGP